MHSKKGSGESFSLSELEQLYSWVGDPVGTQTSTYSLESIDERSKAIWADICHVEEQDRPPVETYTVTATSNGDICRATPEYVRWFRRTYPIAGRADLPRVQAPGAAPGGYGGAPLEF